MRYQAAAAIVALGFAAASGAAQAQTTHVERFNEVECQNLGQNSTPPCTTTAPRSVTTISQTVTPVTAITARLTGVYDVVVDGILGAPGSANYSDIRLTYRGQYNNYLINPAWVAPGTSLARFENYSDAQLEVRALNVTMVSGMPGGSAQLYTPDPTAVTNGSVALAGRYGIVDSVNGISFGRVQGTATLRAAPVNSPSAPNNTILERTVTYTATQTTLLNEDGLITPRIEVTGGIEMNGSQIRNLAAGTAPGDAVNVAQLNQAVAASQAGTAQVATGLSTEVAVRTAADLQLSQRIDAREAVDNTLAAGLASENAARIAADAALSNRIDGLNGRMDQMEARMSVLDDRIASSTAVAVAMSGNSFLPGMRFNLTANVATYDGAHAGSLQIGAMVNEHVAVNAGVGTGFNRRGKTAARAGFTVGW